MSLRTIISKLSDEYNSEKTALSKNDLYKAVNLLKNKRIRISKRSPELHIDTWHLYLKDSSSYFFSSLSENNPDLKIMFSTDNEIEFYYASKYNKVKVWPKTPSYSI